MADTTQDPTDTTFADIRAILRTVSEEQAELARRQQETERMIQETSRQQQETGRLIQETSQQQQETDRLLKEQAQQRKQRDKALDKRLDKRINQLKGVFTSQWGELVESLVQGDLVTLLQGRDVAVNTIHQRAEGRRNGEHYEFDIVAGNGDEVVVTEVKTTLRSEDVAQFLDKLRRFTVYEPRYRGERIYGAVAYLKADGAVVTYAQRQGLFVIRATGDSASIVNDKDFEPAVFA